MEAFGYIEGDDFGPIEDFVLQPEEYTVAPLGNEIGADATALLQQLSSAEQALKNTNGLMETVSAVVCSSAWRDKLLGLRGPAAQTVLDGLQIVSHEPQRSPWLITEISRTSGSTTFTLNILIVVESYMRS
jgi:hypothetical protein